MNKMISARVKFLIVLAAVVVGVQFAHSVGLPSLDKPPCHTDNRAIDLENPFYQGNFGYRYPIDTPSGINGMEPFIALVYNSELEESRYMGVGWELVGYNTMRRNDRRSTPWYDERDTYILTLNGKEYIVYHDGTFEEQGSLTCKRSGDYWVVYEADGTELRFAPSVTSPKGTYSWTLREQKDTNGNKVTYSYDDSLLASDGVAYLSAITYMDNYNESITIELTYEFTNDVDEKTYEPAVSYWAGFKVYYRKRLSQIKAGDVTYKLNYAKSKASGRWLLKEILPSEGEPVSFRYDSDASDSEKLWEPMNPQVALPGLQNYVYGPMNHQLRDYDLLVRDFNNDGLPDLYIQKHLDYFDASNLILDLDYLPQIWLNDGKGGWCIKHDFLSNRTHFDEIRYKHIDEDLFDLSSDVYVRTNILQELVPRIYDADNDGDIDIAITARYKYSAFEIIRIGTDPMNNYGELIDMVPVIRWDLSETVIFLNNGEGGYEFGWKWFGPPPSDIFQRTVSGFTPVGPFKSASIPPVMTDINGDNLPDYFSGGKYYLNQGDGTYQEIVGGHELKNFFDRRRVDLNGDGVPEALSYDKKIGAITCSDPRYNITLSSGVSGDGREYSKGFYEMSGYVYEQFIDINNDGFKDLITLNGIYLNRTKSDRMVAVTGDETIRVVYTPSRIGVDSQYGDENHRNGPRVYRWAVAAIETEDGKTDFSYDGGIYDFVRGKFLGFNRITITDEDGTAVFEYNPADHRMAGKVVSVEGVDGKVSYNYSFSGNKQSWRLEQLTTTSVSTEGIASTVTNSYDDHGNLIRQNRNLQYAGIDDTRTSHFTYSKNPKTNVMNTLESSRDAAGDQTLRETCYYYDELGSGQVDKGNLTRIDTVVWPKETGSEDLTVRIGYDGRGVANAIIDEQGNSTTTELLLMNERFRRRVTRNALGHESYELIDRKTGLTVESVDANGAKTTYTYYDDKRLKRVTQANGGYVVYEYIKGIDGTTNITRTKEDKDSDLLLWHEENYDHRGNLIATVDKQVRAARSDGTGPYTTVGRSVHTRKTYNSRGQVVSESLPYFEGELPRYVHYQYETSYKRRLLQVTQADRTTIRYEYDDLNRRVTIIDSKGGRNVTQETYGYANIEGHGAVACRIVEATDALSNVTRAYYDLDGNLLQIVDANGKAKIYWNDSLGRIYKSKDPYKGEARYVYGSNGQLKNRTDAKGQIISYEYDILNRLTSKAFPGGRRITWQYDRTTADDPIHTYGIGRLSGYQDRSGTTLLGYDVAGNLATKDHAGKKLEFSHDLLGRVRSITYPNQYRVGYSYDALGLSQVRAGSKILASYNDRTAFGAARYLEYGNGLRTVMDYNPENGLLKNIQAGGGYLLNLAFTHDAVGNVQNVQDMAPLTTYHSAPNSESYTYDAINRLIAANGPYGTMSYQYDAVGNIQFKEGVSFAYNDPDHPYAPTEGSNGIKASYDANGNMITKTDAYGNNFSLIYDEENQLIRIWKNDNYTEDYTYDATGYRVARNVGSIKTDYVYWGNTLLYETTGGKAINYVWAEGKMIAKVEQTGTTYFTHDHLGSSKLQTDENGNVLSMDVTKPFGPRVCDAVLRETFDTLDKVNVSGSKMLHDAETGVIKAPAKGRTQGNMLAVNSVVSMLSLDYKSAKSIQFGLTEQDKSRKISIKFVLLGKARIRLVGQDGIEYLSKEYTASTEKTQSVTADLTNAPNQLYMVVLELACSDLTKPAKNSIFEISWGNTGSTLGDVIMLPVDFQEEVRSVRLTWAGIGVGFQVSTDNKTWETVENGKTASLKNPGKRLWVKGLLQVDSGTMLDGYQLEINPAKYSLFTGKTLEESTGLVYFGRRWYDPEFGRFVTVDPVGDGGNWYAYCGGNPINAVDPDGRITFFLNGVGNDKGFPDYAIDLEIALNNRRLVLIPTFENGADTVGDSAKCVAMVSLQLANIDPFEFKYKIPNPIELLVHSRDSFIPPEVPAYIGYPTGSEEIRKAYKMIKRKLNDPKIDMRISGSKETINFVGYSGGAIISYHIINHLSKDPKYKGKIKNFVNIGNGRFQTANRNAKRNILIYGGEDWLVGGSKKYGCPNWTGSMGHDKVYRINGATHPLYEGEKSISYWTMYLDKVVEYVKDYIE